MKAEKPPLHAGARSIERILVIDDDLGICECVQLLLETRGFECVVTNTATQGIVRLLNEPFDLVVTDLKLPDSSGLDVVASVKAHEAELPVILMTSFSSVESAIEALRIGATDYIIKPFHNEEFCFAVERAIKERRTRKENVLLKRTLKKMGNRRSIVGNSESIRKMLAVIQRISSTSANVLIQGESGTGKELVAQALHFGSDRAEHAYVPVNCGAIPAELLESELFGYVKGAFTGAVQASDGLIREASGGTLFLDEISEMPLAIQVKLLRIIQERQVRPLGSSETYATDTRFIAASNRDLKKEVERGAFRADLYYRLNVIVIQVPPLRERGSDIGLLARHFLETHSRKIGKPLPEMQADFLALLSRYDWPGNVRELENLIERAVILADSDVLTTADFTDILLLPSGDAALAATPMTPRTRQPLAAERPLSIEEYIKEFILQHQDTHNENELAAMLGIGRKALWMRRRLWGIHKDRGADAG